MTRLADAALESKTIEGGSTVEVHGFHDLLGAFHAFEPVGGAADDVDLDFEVAPFGYDTGFTGVEDCRTRWLPAGKR